MNEKTANELDVLLQQKTPMKDKGGIEALFDKLNRIEEFSPSIFAGVIEEYKSAGVNLHYRDETTPKGKVICRLPNGEEHIIDQGTEWPAKLKVG